MDRGDHMYHACFCGLTGTDQGITGVSRPPGRDDRRMVRPRPWYGVAVLLIPPGSEEGVLDDRHYANSHLSLLG